MECEIFKVGGYVRDQLLNRQSNDLDFVFVIKDAPVSLDEGFLIMEDYMLSNGYTIFLETPDCVTIRGKRPDGTVGDFVLARKEVRYIEGTRRPNLVLGTLEDDLSHRDFTINALAQKDDGTIIDMFNGIRDLEDRELKTPLDPMVTLTDDPLRALRAVRFCVTLGFDYHRSLWKAFNNPKLPELMKVVSTDKIRQELTKCFKYSNWDAFEELNYLPRPFLMSWLNREDLWLKSTTEKSLN